MRFRRKFRYDTSAVGVSCALRVLIGECVPCGVKRESKGMHLRAYNVERGVEMECGSTDRSDDDFRSESC